MLSYLSYNFGKLRKNRQLTCSLSNPKGLLMIVMNCYSVEIERITTSLSENYKKNYIHPSFFSI